MFHNHGKITQEYSGMPETMSIRL